MRPRTAFLVEGVVEHAESPLAAPALRHPQIRLSDNRLLRTLLLWRSN